MSGVQETVTGFSYAATTALLVAALCFISTAIFVLRSTGVLPLCRPRL